VVIDIHPHARIYSFLLSSTFALLVSFGTVQLLSSFAPNASPQLLGVFNVLLFFILWQQVFGFAISHCAERFTLRPDGFVVETLSNKGGVVPFADLQRFRVRTFQHHSLLSWTIVDNGQRKDRFVYVSFLNMDPEVVEKFNMYLRHNIHQKTP